MSLPVFVTACLCLIYTDICRHLDVIWPKVVRYSHWLLAPKCISIPTIWEYHRGMIKETQAGLKVLELVGQLVTRWSEKNKTQWLVDFYHPYFFTVSNLSECVNIFEYLIIYVYSLHTWLQTMQQMNKVMDPQKLAGQMQEFSKESMKMGMSEEMSESSWVLSCETATTIATSLPLPLHPSLPPPLSTPPSHPLFLSLMCSASYIEVQARKAVYHFSCSWYSCDSDRKY